MPSCLFRCPSQSSLQLQNGALNNPRSMFLSDRSGVFSKRKVRRPHLQISEEPSSFAHLGECCGSKAEITLHKRARYQSFCTRGMGEKGCLLSISELLGHPAPYRRWRLTARRKGVATRAPSPLLLLPPLSACCAIACWFRRYLLCGRSRHGGLVGCSKGRSGRLKH
jgi:hypothetical protein